jgi:hypothetical protein
LPTPAASPPQPGSPVFSLTTGSDASYEQELSLRVSSVVRRYSTARPRAHHQRALPDAATVHRRYGVQAENIFRALATSATGVAPLKPRDLARMVSGASARASARRMAVRRDAVEHGSPPPDPGSSASLDLTRQFLPDVDGHVCAAIFMDRATWHIWIGPMRDHSCTEFIRVFQAYRAFVKTTFRVDLRTVLADSDPCFTDNSGVPKNVAELQRVLDTFPASESVEFVHSPPYTQALNPVECAVRQLYHLMNFFLQKGHLSVMCWLDMARAAAYAMNRLPHPQSKHTERRSKSAYELVTGRKPDLSDMIAGPGELVVADFVGAKAKSGSNTGAFAYFIMPNEGGWLVRSFETNKISTTHDVRRLSSPGKEMSDLIAARHALRTGMFRDGSGLAGAPASAVASGRLSLLADAARNGGSDNPYHYLVLLDPGTGHPSRLVTVTLSSSSANVLFQRPGLSRAAPPLLFAGGALIPPLLPGDPSRGQQAAALGARPPRLALIATSTDCGLTSEAPPPPPPLAHPRVPMRTPSVFALVHPTPHHLRP